MGIPSGTSYPKMVTVAQGAGGGLVPAMYPAGNAKQFQFVVFRNATDEAAYTSNGVAPISAVPSGHGNSWENRHGG